MENKKDIGSFFKERLTNGKIAPKPGLWEKISQSWEHNLKERKKLKIFWMVTGGILVALSVLLVFSTEYFSPQQDPVQPEVMPMVKQINFPPEAERNNNSTTSGKDSLLDSNSNSRFSENLEIQKGKKEVEVHSDTKQPKHQKVKQNALKKDGEILDNDHENNQVITKYHYSRSEDDKQIITTDKKLIDSLIFRQEQKIHTDQINVKDSTVIENGVPVKDWK